MKLSLQETLKSLYMPEKVVKLSFRYTELTDSYIPVIHRILKANPAIQTLDLEGNLISDEGVKHICDIISACPGRLSSINLDFNSITPYGGLKLLNSVSERDKKSKTPGTSKISSITLSFNKFDNCNDLYAKAWEYFEKKGIEIKNIIDKKHLLATSSSNASKLFLKISESFENPEIKEFVSSLLRIHVEDIRPKVPNTVAPDLDIDTSNILNTFQSMFLTEEVKTSETAENATSVYENTPKTVPLIFSIDIDSVFKNVSNFNKVVDGLIENGVSVDAIDNQSKENMIMWAARNGNLKLIQHLITKNADIHLCNV